MGDEHGCHCGATFDSYSSLIQHIEATGHDEDIDYYPDDEVFTCSCGAEFDSLASAEQHGEHCEDVQYRKNEWRNE